MAKLIIKGGRRLEGEIDSQGAKNSILPILAATVLCGGKSVIHNCPELQDVRITVKILERLGCTTRRQGRVLIVDSSDISEHIIPDDLMRQMRSSIIFLGAVLTRFGRAVVSLPGGCEIGNRPIDLHIKALKMLGVEIKEEHGYIDCRMEKPHGEKIHLDFPSVGATENIMLAACMIDGETVITNAAREPEIVDLENFLNKMGAKISGAGSDVIKIVGVKKLYGVEHTIIPDRIAGATYLLAGAITGGNVILRNANPNHMGAMISTLGEMGCRIYSEKSRVILTTPSLRLKAASKLVTMPYPGFPTDIQSPFMALSSVCEGTGIFVENIFENRFQHVEELARMGADIKVDGRVAVVLGVPKLSGAKVVAKELRGGAALVIAGLSAEGITEIDNVKYIDRGYEDIEKYLSICGANIRREE